MNSEKSKVDLLLEKVPNTQDTIFIQTEKGVVPLVTEELLKKYSSELVDVLMGKVRKYNDFGMANALLKQIIDFKKAFWPATQKTITGTADDLNKMLDKWKTTRLELEKAKSEGKAIITYDYIGSPGLKVPELNDDELTKSEV
jgi:hypothetical protein